MGVYDAEATAASKEKHSDSSILKDPASGDASQKYVFEILLVIKSELETN